MSVHNTISSNLILETDKVILRPVLENDFDAFLNLAQQDEDMWKYFSLNLADASHLKAWMEAAVTDRQAGTRRPFTIIDKSTNQIAGSSSMEIFLIMIFAWKLDGAGWEKISEALASTLMLSM